MEESPLSSATRRRLPLRSFTRIVKPHSRECMPKYGADAAGEWKRRPGLAQEEATDVGERWANLEGHGGPRRAMGRRGQGKGRGHAGDGRRRRLQVSGTIGHPNWAILVFFLHVPTRFRANALSASCTSIGSSSRRRGSLAMERFTLPYSFASYHT